MQYEYHNPDFGKNRVETLLASYKRISAILSFKKFFIEDFNAITC